MAQEKTFTLAIRQIETLRDEVNQKFLSDNQILVIFNIFDMANPQGIKAPYLGKLCNLEGPTLTRILQTLSAEGRKSGPKPMGLISIETDPTDKRQKIIHLTSEGERVKSECERAIVKPRTQYVLDAQAAAFNVSYGEIEATGKVGQRIAVTANSIATDPPQVQDANLKEIVFTSKQALADFKRKIETDESGGMAEMFSGYTMRIETEEDRIERIITHDGKDWVKQGAVGGILSHDGSGVVGVYKDYADGIFNKDTIELKPQSWVIEQLVRGRRTALAKGDSQYQWRGHDITILSPHDARGMTFGEYSEHFGLQLDGVWFVWQDNANPQEDLPKCIVRDLFDDEVEDTIEYVAKRLNAIDDNNKPIFSFADEMDDLKRLLNLNQYKKMRNRLVHAVADVATPLEKLVDTMGERRAANMAKAKHFEELARSSGLSLQERQEFQRAAIEAHGDAQLNAQAMVDAKVAAQQAKQNATKLQMEAMVEDAKERVEQGEDDDPEN